MSQSFRFDGSLEAAKKQAVVEYQLGNVIMTGPQGEDIDTILDSFPLEELEDTIGRLNSSKTFTCRGNVTIINVTLETFINKIFRKMTPAPVGKMISPTFYRFRGISLAVTPLADFSIGESRPQITISIVDDRIKAIGAHPAAILQEKSVASIGFPGDGMYGVWINQRYYVSERNARFIKLCVQISGTTAMESDSDLFQGTINTCVERTRYPKMFVMERAIAVPIPAMKDTASVVDTKRLQQIGNSIANVVKQLKAEAAREQTRPSVSRISVGNVIPELGGPAPVECARAREGGDLLDNKTPSGKEPIYGKYQAQLGLCIDDLDWSQEEDWDAIEPEIDPCAEYNYGSELVMAYPVMGSTFKQFMDGEEIIQFPKIELVPVRRKEITRIFNDGEKIVPMDVYNVSSYFQMHELHSPSEYFGGAPPPCKDIEPQMFRGLSQFTSDVTSIPSAARSAFEDFKNLSVQWSRTGENIDAIIDLATRSLEDTRTTVSPIGHMIDSITSIFANLKEGILSNSVLQYLTLGEDAWPDILKAFSASAAILVAIAYCNGDDHKSSMWQAAAFLSIVWSPLLIKASFNIGSFLLAHGQGVISSLLEAVRGTLSPPQKVHEGGVNCVAQAFSSYNRIDLVEPAVRCIVLVLGGVAFYALNGANPMPRGKEQTMFKKLGEFGRDIGGMSYGVKTISEWSTLATNFIKDWIFELFGSSDPHINEMKLVLSLDPMAWSSEVIELHLLENRQLNLGDPQYVRKIRLLYDTGKKFQEFASLHTISPGLSRRIGDAFKLVTELYNEITTSKGVNQRRIDPYHTCLYGIPSAGKTFLMDSLLNTVLNYFGEPVVDRKYSRSVADKYWSGYHGQLAITLDDLGAVMHNDTPSDITELLNLKSNEPHMVNMAAVEEKGRFFTSKYIFSTTNMKALDNGCGLREPGAFYRRRDAFILVERKKGANGELLPRSLDFSHLEFTFLRTFPKFDKIACLEAKMDYPTFIKTLLIDMSHYYDDQARALKGVGSTSEVIPRCVEDLATGVKPHSYPLVAQASFSCTATPDYKDPNPKDEEVFEDAEGEAFVVAKPKLPYQHASASTRTGMPRKPTNQMDFFLRRAVYIPGGNIVVPQFVDEEANRLFVELPASKQVQVVVQLQTNNLTWEGIMRGIIDVFKRCALSTAMKSGDLKVICELDSGVAGMSPPQFVSISKDPDIEAYLYDLDRYDTHILWSAFQLREHNMRVVKKVQGVKADFQAWRKSAEQCWLNLPAGVRVAIKVAIGGACLVGACTSLQYLYNVMRPQAPISLLTDLGAPATRRILGPFAALTNQYPTCEYQIKTLPSEAQERRAEETGVSLVVAEDCVQNYRDAGNKSWFSRFYENIPLHPDEALRMTKLYGRSIVCTFDAIVTKDGTPLSQLPEVDAGYIAKLRKKIPSLSPYLVGAVAEDCVQNYRDAGLKSWFEKFYENIPLSPQACEKLSEMYGRKITCTFDAIITRNGVPLSQLPEIDAKYSARLKEQIPFLINIIPDVIPSLPQEGDSAVPESAPADLVCDKYAKKRMYAKLATALAAPSVNSVAETTNDEMALGLCKTTFAESLGIFYVSREDGTYFYEQCCFIGGTLIVLPAHIFFKMFEGDDISIFDLRAETILRYEKSRLKIVRHDRDIAIYDCGARLQSRKHLTRHFISNDGVLKMRGTPGALLGLTLAGDRLSMIMKFVDSIQTNEVMDGSASYLVDGDTPHTLVKCWKYRTHTSAGECGSLLVRFDPSAGPKLLGFHVASRTNQNLGYSEIITSEDLEMALSCHSSLTPQFTGIGIDYSLLGLGGIEKSRMKRLPENDVLFVGALPAGEGVRVPDVTSIIPSRLHDAIGPHKSEPCILSPLDPRCPPDFTPLCAGLSKFGEPTKPFPSADIAAVADSIYMDVKYLDNSVKSRALLSDTEMINGRPGVPFFDRINLNSSEGYPYVLRRPKNRDAPGKRWMFKETGESSPSLLVVDIADEELKAKLALRESEGRKGRRVPSFSMECVKDERVLLPKIYEKPKSRLFTILPVDYNLLVRKTCMDFVVMTMENRAALPPAVGINPFSDEWSAMYHRLREFSPHGFAGDYKLFDGQADPEIIRAIFGVINKWYGGTEEENMLRTTLADEISHRHTLGLNALFAINRGIPSGIPITVIINSYINMFYLRLAWRLLAPQDMRGMSYFRANVLDIVYGDDNNVAIKPEVLGFYNLSTISAKLLEYGITLTDHHKKVGAEALPHIPVDEFSFLKREFVPHPHNHLLIRCPLVKTSIEEQIHWIRKGGDDIELLIDNINRSLIEAVQHGEPYFDDLQERIAKACCEIGLPPPKQSFKELDEEWCCMASGLDPMIKGYHLSGPKLERLRAKYTPFGAL